MLKPIPLFAIPTITSMWLNWNSLRRKMGHWDESDESSWLCMLFSKQVWESKYQTLVQCFAFGHIWLCFHRSSTKANPCMIYSHSHYVHSQLQHSLVKFLNIKNHYSLLHVLCENVNFWSHRSYLTYEEIKWNLSLSNKLSSPYLRRKIKVVDSYAHLRVAFTNMNGCFSIIQVVKRKINKSKICPFT